MFRGFFGMGPGRQAEKVLTAIIDRASSPPDPILKGSMSENIDAETHIRGISTRTRARGRRVEGLHRDPSMNRPGFTGG